MVTDNASLAAGASIVMATSNDPSNPAQNILDGSDQTFWASTGLFPQEIIISLPAKVPVERFTLSARNAKNVTVQRCEEATPKNFSVPIPIQI